MKAGTDSRKQSLYFPEDMLAELHNEAVRLDRSLSWVIQYAWEHGGAEAVKKLQTIPRRSPR